MAKLQKPHDAWLVEMMTKLQKPRDALEDRSDKVKMLIEAARRNLWSCLPDPICLTQHPSCEDRFL